MTKADLEKKHAALLKEKGSLLATEDGQVFYNTDQGKRYASGHAAVNKLQVIELKYKAAPKKKKDSKND